MATKSNSQRLRELKTKREEEQKKASSQSKIVKNSDRVRKLNLERTIGFDTLETDLNSLGKTVQGIYGGWQTEETMRNTRSSIESMYNRLTSYQDYRKTYGITDGEKDIADLVNNYKTTLDNWDSLASHYGEYKDADAYKKAEKAQADAKKRKKDMANADLDVVEKEITDLEGMLKKANDYNSKVSGYQTSESAAQRYSGRNGFVYNPDNESSKKLNSAQKELNEYLKSVGYSNVDDIKKALKDKQSFLEEAKVIQKENHYTDRAWSGYGIQGYEQYIADEYKRKEYAKANQPSAFEEGVIRGFTTSSDNPISTIINNVIYDKRKDDSYQRPNDKWSQEQKYEFGARYLENPQIAYEYAAKVNNEIAEEKENATKSKVDENSTSNGWSAIGNWVGARLTAPFGLADYLDDLTDIAAGRDTIVQEGVLTPFEYSQTVDESQASALNEWSGTLNENIPVLGEKGLGDALSFGNSIVDSKVSALTTGSVGTLINYFGQAAASGVDDAMSRGASGKQALLYGTAQGLAEAIPEMISAEKYLNLGKNTDLGFWGKFHKQGKSEMLEEPVTSVLGNFADDIIMGDKSNYNTEVKNLMLKEGLGESQAKKKAFGNSAGDIAFDALGGYFSGAIGSVGQAALTTKYEKYIKENYGESAEDLIAEGLESGKDTESYKLAVEAKQKIESGKELNTEELSQLVSANAEAYKTEVSTDAKKRLSELGSKDDNSQLADIVAKKTAGYQLTKSEAKTLQNSQYGNRVYNEINNEELVSYTENMSESDANLFLSQYDGNSSISAYAESFNLVSELSSNDFSQDYILEHKGTLSNNQVSAIYKANVLDVDKRLQKTLNSLKTKHKGAKFIKGTFDDSVIDYTNSIEGDVSTPNGNRVRWDKLNDNQKKSIATLGEFFSGLGLDVTLISDGLERGINGAFEVSGNRVLLDVYAGIDKINASDLQDTIVPTASHEVVHWSKNLSPEIYRKLDRFAFDSLMSGTSKTEADILAERRRLMEKAHPNVKYTDAEVREEVIARACEDMLVNTEMFKKCCESMTESERKNFKDKIKEIIQNIKDWIDEFISKQKSQSPEAKKIREDMARFKEQVKLFEEMLEDAALTNQALKHEGIIAEQLVNGISEDGTTIVGKNNIQMSERTYAEGGRDFLEKWLSEQEGLTDADKKDILFQTDAIANLMKDIRENNELPEYARWASMDVVKDENGEKVLSVIVKNGDYAMNIDFSQVCKKRVALNAVLNAMVQSGDLNAYTLTETDVADLNAIIKKHEFEIACALCFVDSKRYRVGSWAESFCEGADKKKNGKMVHQYGFNEMVRSLVPKGSKIQIDEFNFTNRNIVGQPTSNLLSEMDDSELDFTLIDEILEREFKAGSKPTDLYAYAKAIKDNKELRKILNPAEIISSIGLDAIRLENKELYSLINRHQGTARPKFAHDVVAYTNDVLKASNFTKEKAKMVGGVRCQSFSDFMANMVFDYVQFISELSAKELTSHSYTKEPLFVRLFGMTGMKINMSLVPKAVQMTPEQQKYFAILNDPNANKRSAEYQKAKRDYKKLTVNAGLDENGNYIWEDETFPYDIAMELVVDPRYSANCGTIAVGISDAHILKLLNDDKISMVIPYHKSGLNHIVAKMRNIDLYKDYTTTQNTRFANGKKLEGVPNFDFYGDLYGADGKEGTHNPKQTADNYLKWCDEHNYIPKFEDSINSRKFRDNPNYYKLLVDFRVYDTDGTYREQQPVKPIYPSNEEFKDLILNGVKDKNGKVYGGLKQQQGTSDKLDAESKQIVDEFRNKLKEKYGKDVLATKNSDRDKAYMDAVNRGDMETAQRMVDEAAKKNGFPERLLHGTNKYGFTKVDVSKSDDKISFFATDSEETAGTYSSNKKVKRIADANKAMPDAEIEKAKKDIDDLAQDFAEYCNKTLGIRGWVDYDYFSTKLDECLDELEGGTSSLLDVERDFNEFCDELYYSFEENYYEVNYGDNPWLDESEKISFYDFGQSEEADKLCDDFWACADKITSAMSLIDPSTRSGLYDLFANTDNHMVLDCKGLKWDRLNIDDLPSISSPEYKKYGYRNHWDAWTTRSVAAYAKDLGYSGVTFKDIIDSGDGSYIKPATVYIFFNPQEQVKSADPVTYDDNGNVIPLSQRFNKENDDIRYSDRDAKRNTVLDGQISFLDDSSIDSTEQTASDFVSAIKGIVKETGGWRRQDVYDYVAEHPELNFIERIYEKDKTVKKDLEKFLSEINDVKLLDNFSWYLGRGYGQKDYSYNWDLDRYDYPYRGAVRTFTNAIKKRINEIVTQRVGGTNLGVENGEVTLVEIRDMFNKLNSNEDVGMLAEKVFDTADKLGINIRFVNKSFSNGDVGYAFGDMVEYKTSYFNDTARSDQRKAEVILHELIHTCTVYIMENNKSTSDRVYYAGKTDNYNTLANAATRLNAIYNEIKADADFKGQYGIKNSFEMVAELANEDFVALLKKKSLWDRIVDAIARLFGFSRGNTAYDNIMQCVDYILDNPEISEYKAFAKKQRQYTRSAGQEVFGYTKMEDGRKLYSDRDNVSVYDKLGETDKLIKDNEKLKADVERLKERLKIERQVTHGNFFNENQLNAVAGHIRNIGQSNYDKKDLVNSLNSIYQYIAHSPDLNWQDLYSQCYDLADKVLDKSRPITETNPYYQDILDDIRKTKISVNEQQIQNAKYSLGNKWRNSFFNKISISENGISLDSQWQEWSSMYPNIFDADLSDADQLVELLDIYDSVRQASETVVEYDKEERTRWLAREIYNQYWNVSPIRTTADKYDKQIKRLNYEHRKAMQELRESRDEKLKEQHKIDKEKAQNLVKKIRERKDKEIAEVKQKSKEMMSAYKENAEKKTKIQSITSNALTLNKWLTTNSKDYHINETLKPVVVNLLQAIDFSSKQMLNRNIPTNKDISLYKALQDVKNMFANANKETALSDLTEMYGIDMDEDIAKMLESSFDTLTSLGDNGYILNKMSLDELNTLNKVVKTIKQVVTKLNKFHVANHYKGVINLSQNSIGFFDKLGKAKVYDPKSAKGRLAHLINWNNLNPFYAFKKFGDGGKVMFEALQDGQDKLAYHIKEIIDFTKEAYTSKEVRDWSNEVKDIKVHDMITNKDVTVHITVAQAMSLYCSLKREQAKGHILGDGIRITDISVKKGKVISQAEGIKLGISDIAALTGILDSKQKVVADKLQNFMNTICTDWGNEISMARFGYKAFGEPNYFPISSDKNNLAVDDAKEESNSLFRLLNMSFTKSTVKGANNKVEIKNIFDVFAQHTSDMAKYNAFALPILDFYKWFNYTEKGMVNGEKRTVASLKASMEKAFGKEAKEYVTNFLKDINGQYDVSRDKLGKGFFKSAKIAAVGMNLRVVLLQPTSYVRASAVINNKYLTKALLHKPKISKAEQHCGMALWKSLGYYDTNIQRGITEQIKHDETWKDKAVEVSMKGAEIADKLTWGYLWNACELEIRETRKDLEVGSKEFYETIGKRLREVIYATQVVDSTMTRSQMMRSQSFYDKMLTAFASEPTLAYNMLYDSIESAHLEKRANGKVSKDSLKKMARVMVAYTMTNVVAALVESGFDAFRDEDDEEMDIAEFMKLYLTNFSYDMSITAKLPYVKEVVSVLQGFTSSRTDTQWMQSLGYALKGWVKVFAGDGNPVSAIKNSLRSMAYVSGLPFYNAYRDFMATLNKLDILTAEELEEFFEDLFS